MCLSWGLNLHSLSHCPACLLSCLKSSTCTLCSFLAAFRGQVDMKVKVAECRSSGGSGGKRSRISIH